MPVQKWIKHTQYPEKADDYSWSGLTVVNWKFGQITEIQLRKEEEKEMNRAVNFNICQPSPCLQHIMRHYGDRASVLSQRTSADVL